MNQKLNSTYKRKKRGQNKNHKFSISPSKKAQMEMMGLVVIVILITLGMFFMISFGLKEDKTEKKFTRQGLAASTMGAIMKATTSSEENCGLIEFENDLLEDCAINYGSPDYAYQFSCRNMNSCDFLDEVLNKTLAETLWEKEVDGKKVRSLKRRYELSAHKVTFEGTKQDPALFIIKDPSNRGCPKKAADTDEETYFVNTGTGQVQTTLKLCQ